LGCLVFHSKLHFKFDKRENQLKEKVKSFFDFFSLKNRTKGKRKMKTTKNRISAGITLFLMLTIALSMFCLPKANAVTLETWTYFVGRPNPIGVGQTELLEMWLDAMPPYINFIPIVPWTFTIDVTKPSGSTENLGNFTSDAVGGAWTTYTPTTAGTYTFKCSFFGAEVSGNTYSPSSSTFTLTVQEEPIAEWPGAPLSTEYWTRPIEAENREWDQIAGNWLSVPCLWAAGWSATGAFSP